MRTLLLLPLAALVSLLGLSAPAWAINGTVLDGAQRPIEGANVCYMLASVENGCVRTNSAGYYELEPAELTEIRIFKSGYLPRQFPAVDQKAAIVLEPAAKLFVRLLDRTTGEGVVSGVVRIGRADGRQRGPFACNQAGLRVGSLAPGRVSLEVTGVGYMAASTVTELIAGKEVRVAIELDPIRPAKKTPDGK
jgi:hypothetical protein